MKKRVNPGKPLSVAAVIVLAFLIPLFMKDVYILHILIMATMSIILASSLRLILTSGQMSLGHGGMMAIGAYTSAIMVMKLGLSTWVLLPVAGLAAAVVALLVGYPFTRLKGIYFVMVTVFLAQIVELILEQWRSMTGGTSGLTSIPRPNAIVIPGLLNIDFSSKAEFYYLILVISLVSLLILYALEHSYIGRNWKSIQQSDSLAESVGINTARYKVLAFTIGCFFAGIAGAFYAHYMAVLTPSGFGFLYAVYTLVYMVAGGMKRFAGPIIGAVVLTILPEWVRVLKVYQPILFAAVLILIIFFLPEGIVSLPERLKKFITERFNRARNPATN